MDRRVAPLPSTHLRLWYSSIHARKSILGYLNWVEVHSILLVVYE